MRQALILLVLLVATACDTTASLKSLRSTDLTGSAFNIQLARLYRDLADKEVEKYNWWTSKRFADKGLAVANGTYQEPEDPRQWDVKGEPLEALTKAREALVVALSTDFKEKNPEQAAKAQAGFDCWVRLEEDGWKDREISTCKKQYETAMNEAPSTAVADGATAPAGEIDSADATPVESASADEARPAKEAKEPMGGPLNTSLLFFFDWDSSKLDKNSEDELKDITKDIIKTHAETKADFEIVINGHADKTGTDEYNMELSRKRAEYVSRFMAEHGISKSHITYYAFGKSDPLVDTADGVKERKNRRVEIFLE